jgi:hypothetical protein
MTTRLVIGRIALDMADAQRARQVEGTLRAALDIVAERLEGAPLPRGVDVRRLALDKLELTLSSPADLVGGAAAERLADQLLRALIRAAPGATRHGGAP